MSKGRSWEPSAAPRNCCVEVLGGLGVTPGSPLLDVAEDTIKKQIEDGRFWGSPLCHHRWMLGMMPSRSRSRTGDFGEVLGVFRGSPRADVAEDVIEKQIEDGLLKPELREKLSYVLLRKHRHQTKKPIHRSLADIGKSVSSNTGESSGSSRHLVAPSGVGEGHLGRREGGTQGVGTPRCLLPWERPQNSAPGGFRGEGAGSRGGVQDMDGAVGGGVATAGTASLGGDVIR